jgi:cellulose synthase/poly-beta-1,6-N-acetylglucosamine synthase-like glycosyltransferase
MIDGSGQFLKESKRGFPSPATSMFKLTGLANLFPSSKLFARYYLGHLPQNKTSEVDVLSGAFMMVSKKILDSTGGFDELFFMYGEDIDLSYRIQKAGFHNFYYADCSIIHFKGESTKKQTVEYIRIFYGAMKLFVKKHYALPIVFAFTFIIEIVIIIKSLIAVLKNGYDKISRLIFRKKAATKVFLNTIVVAEKQGNKEVVSILENSDSSKLIVGRVGSIDYDSDVIGSIDQLPELIIQHNINHILLCNDGIRIYNLVELIQQLPLSVSYSFHLKGTSSIVGSNDKNTGGYFLAEF